MPSNADANRAWLLNELGLSSSTLSNSDLEAQLYSSPSLNVKNWQRPKNVVAETIDRRNVSSSAIAIVSARLQYASVYLQAGQRVTGIGVISGNVAAVTPTNQWAALYDGTDHSKIAVTEDKTTEAWAANTKKTFVFTPALTISKSGVYRVIFCMVAPTIINLVGTTKSSNIDFANEDAMNQLNGQADAGQTTPGAAPAVLGAIGATNTYPYMQVV